MSSMTAERMSALWNFVFPDNQANPEDFSAEELSDPDVLNLIHELMPAAYDGPADAESMYWFMKGSTLAPPSPAPRYDQSEEFLQSQRHRQQQADRELFARMDARRRADRQRAEEALESRREAEEAIREGRRREREEFSRTTGFDSYEAFREANTDQAQQARVDAIMLALESNPTEWSIRFNELTNSGRELLSRRLKDFFETYIDEFLITDGYLFSFLTRDSKSGKDQWVTRAFTPELYRKLILNFNENSLTFDLDERPPEYFYEQGSQELPDWSLFSAIWLHKEPIKKKPSESTKEARNEVAGSFFRYLTDNVPPRVVDYLSRLQIFDTLVDSKKSSQRRELDDCCFIYALRMLGVDAVTLDKMRLRVNVKHLSARNVNSLCEEFKIHLKVHYITEDAVSKNKSRPARISTREGDKVKAREWLGIAKKDAVHVFEMNLFEQHYFVEERTPFTSHYVEHIDDLEEDKFNRFPDGGSLRVATQERRFMKSGALVRALFKSNHFKPITYGEFKVFNTVFYNETRENVHYSLDYDPAYCTKLIAPIKAAPVKRGEVLPSYYFADSEADVSGPTHKPYMMVIHNLTGSETKEFRGQDCALELLKWLPHNAVVYFHNLAYDGRFFAKYGIAGGIRKGNKMMTAKIVTDQVIGKDKAGKDIHKTVQLKDSLPILSCPLKRLPKMFNIPDVQKEIFPYKYYTLDRLESNIGTIEGVGDHEDEPWTASDYETFKANIDSIPGCRLSDSTFDMWLYASFYCQQDVRILRLGFTEFRKGFIKEFRIDPFKFVSVSSLANEVFNQKVYFPNGNLFKVSGHVRHFLSKAVYGGRCMCAYNKKWDVQVPLSDFDAVSLYPSAMARLYTTNGRPKVIQPDQLNKEFLFAESTSAFVVDIRITAVHKHLAFPLITRKTADGLNLNDDHITEPVEMTVDNILLEDLIEFQKIDFEFIRGYYWNEGRDYTIQDEIKKIFNKRVEYKAAKNPLQELYKLIMNSTYGKTIERPVEKDFKYVREGEDLDRYWKRHYNRIVEDVCLADSDIHAIKKINPINNHFNFSLLGIHVLSMSKRIMNEVMCLAFDLGCRIYYQDTDSMHIEVEALPKLVDAFRQKYSRELIGSGMGQFHSDFTSDTGRDDVQHAVHSVFIMKKMYIDELLMSDDSVEYMIRGKGLTQKSIKHAVQTRFDGNVMALYQSLFEGKSETFDLTVGVPSFAMNPDLTISTRTKFQRTTKTNYTQGNRDEYFLN